ncbi:hypothetical protein [Acetanaerobacterium elongatum]|uniref:Uncharacterized protein n=1 Tax=Acetanaerobacterium elongatum TaxID=258515 RepID=A0A1G9YD03_9FIRM|nr:hypothetical protein [Acetanaerobacterium elongatum]SDN06847.1 hypothetical protein SAMN05192585_11089 [Acetanaerobacterium elongatum]
MSENKELTTTAQSGYLLVADFNMSESIADELAGLDLTFDRIKIPSGGGTVYEVPGEDSDECDTVKEFSAVILYHHPVFAFYKEKYTGGSNPPDCGSYDGITGEGNPGGKCRTCPLNQFGSAENNGKACKNRRRIYLLREGEVFPLILSLPTGSIKEFTRYIQRLLGKGRKSYGVVTKFALKKASSNSGIAYSQATFGIDRVLTDEEIAAVRPLANQVKAMSRKVGYDMDEPAEMPINVDPETGEVIEPLK